MNFLLMSTASRLLPKDHVSQGRPLGAAVSRARIATAALLLAALGLFAAAPVHAARNPDKPDRVDKPEKPDRVEKPDRNEKPKRAERRERAEFAAATSQPETTGRRDRSLATDSGGRPARTDSPGRAERAASTAASAAPGGAGADAQFEPFRIITEKNIFNPNRVGRTRAAAEDAPPRLDVIALVGTLHSDGGAMAFFESPDPALRKALREGESVGDFKVERIRPDGVDLARADKPVSLRVAQELRRPEGGDWSVATTEPRAAPPPGAAPASAAPAAPPAIPPGASDALRRLMEQRQKQLKQ